ncbi:MAG: flavodoxin-dependent (E)-4-hydroxy-3-methylbut-2-enyl-diphosphate synthase [Actinomycetota bacterium]|jgi:(E)-4-hydroxy-3-methylbut-2-enyl-diphosphate synthase|nr:flavodoxin-dependent (E)-4-hydroxy-3-methylbut-2-enyl-diphosphate synthase [Actinomycetota bacterium]MCL6092229.1 flavodoxin-dependent (E)-4-hydroxy-3-methylbut-2-enyl-diphosphate synthase [Actinomycetota bacterium]MDA8167657.1 flavodoxin-dependent (E)-4-hydroxy-3-methylbut-2-enyl-diphosphate synthase [Actinomycetota bacterium]
MASKIQIRIGNVPIGGGAPVAVQSMTSTDTRDAEATLGQIRSLAAYGCEIARVAVPDEAAVAALERITAESPLPVVADVHFQARLAIASVAAGAAGLRINPGNIGSRERVAAVVEAARQADIPIRIGVNAGSLPKAKRRQAESDPVAALVETTLDFVQMFEDMDFHNFKVSAKSSSVPETIGANLALANLIDYPLHLGITEAGTRWAGSIRSAAGIGALLARGVGDTIRVSLTGDPVEEVRTAYELLQCLGLRERGASLISCPTCGRTEIDVEAIAVEVEERLRGYERKLEVAVMGCVVNGPGEARRADYGIAGGRGEGLIFAHGEPIRKVAAERLVAALFEEIEKNEAL